jgi:hypothetical protein
MAMEEAGTMSLNGRLSRIEQQLTQQPDPGDRELARELTELNEFLLSFSKAEVLTWIDAQLARLGEDSGWLDLLTDWKEFLTLKGQNTAADWDRERGRPVETENSKRWHELDKKYGWCGRWTGRGVPPQLIPGDREFWF